ncbi:hypothetical protein BDZ91DRAFT_145620 [Kalaharituber pfeilii]|nr:hypothetical protein BDZ91DRAFT_145620 [Kalaharituber pfeilii]
MVGQRPHYRTSHPAIILFTFATSAYKVTIALPVLSLDREPAELHQYPANLDSSETNHQSSLNITLSTCLSIVNNFPTFCLLLLLGVCLAHLLSTLIMPKTIRKKIFGREEKQDRREPRMDGVTTLTELPKKEKAANHGDIVPDASIADINKILIEAAQKGCGEVATESEKSTVDATRTARFKKGFRARGQRRPQLPLLSLGCDDTYNYGENPAYHDNSFHYTRPSFASSTPPPPLSSCSYATKIRKLSSHKRSLSLPTSNSTVPIISPLRKFMSTSQFPLPTLRPATPPGVRSTPATPTTSAHDGRLSVFHYSKNWSQGSRHHLQHLHCPTQSVAPVEDVTSAINGSRETMAETPVKIIEGEREITIEESAEDVVAGSEFQPVMILEHGQTVAGQKWRRKVTVFSGELLERLQREGMMTV